ncbi:hypothetical protein ACPV50_04395 [Vibrio astriarenae]
MKDYPLLMQTLPRIIILKILLLSFPKLMSKQYRIDSNIYEFISQTEVSVFTVIEVRNWVIKYSDTYGNKTNARQFVARQLDSLEASGLIFAENLGRKKVYSKSPQFFAADFKIIVKKKRNQKAMESVTSQKSPIFEELQKEKTNIEAELAITLAEVDEYKALMDRSSDLNRLLKASYSEATQKSATLVAKLNVWTHTMSLLTLNRPSAC